ncbi:MAG: hypothetical protein HWE35_19350 [Rhodobacteraceae bacterium]|nr:hypothetical protein [Paracoccaceae bacterium]
MSVHLTRNLAKTKVLGSPSQTSSRIQAALTHSAENWAQVAQEIEVKGRGDYFALRKCWSWALLIWISLLIVFNAALTVAVGRKWLTFDAEWFVTAVTVETFLQVVAMGFVAVNYLFSDGRSNTPTAHK